jgi:hypothetical protein
MKGTAKFSDDMKRRYHLTRDFENGSDSSILWIMCNPSLAGATDTDPTIRRVMTFSQDWGFGAMRVCNLSPIIDPYAWEAALAEPVQ